MNLIYDIKRFLISKKALPALFLCLCVGVVLTLVANINTKNDKETEKPPLITYEGVDEDKISESGLENILSKVKGVGEVEVMIIYASSNEKILAKDIDSQGNEKTVSKNESVKNEPYVVKTNAPDIEGVIVVAEGGGVSSVKNLLVDCISNTLNIPIHKVKVLEMN